MDALEQCVERKTTVTWHRDLKGELFGFLMTASTSSGK